MDTAELHPSKTHQEKTDRITQISTLIIAGCTLYSAIVEKTWILPALILFFIIVGWPYAWPSLLEYTRKRKAAKREKGIITRLLPGLRALEQRFSTFIDGEWRVNLSLFMQSRCIEGRPIIPSPMAAYISMTEANLRKRLEAEDIECGEFLSILEQFEIGVDVFERTFVEEVEVITRTISPDKLFPDDKLVKYNSHIADLRQFIRDYKLFQDKIKKDLGKSGRDIFLPTQLAMKKEM
jgi:hypothetical protein